MTDKRRKSHDGSPRTEVFAMRLDPKLKYLAEIASRKQRRSLANFVEWAVERALSEVPLNAMGDSGQAVTVADKAAQLWGLDEVTRLVNLATLYPDLLTYEEQRIWDVICQYSTRVKGTTKRVRFRENGVVNLQAIRFCWVAIKPFALGTTSKEEMDEVVDTYEWVQGNGLDDGGDQHG
jgi:hypothetical protein